MVRCQKPGIVHHHTGTSRSASHWAAASGTLRTKIAAMVSPAQTSQPSAPFSSRICR